MIDTDALRGLATLIAIYIFTLMVTEWKRAVGGMEVSRFTSGGAPEVSVQIAIAFSRIRSSLSDLFWVQEPFALPSKGPSSLALVLPRFHEPLPDVSIGAGVVKVSLGKSLWSSVFRPRFLIKGSAQPTSHGMLVHAETWERRHWLGYKLRSVRTRELHGPINGAGIADLEALVYDVFLGVLHASR